MEGVDFIFNGKAYNVGTIPHLHLTHNEGLYKTQLGRAYKCSTVEVGGLAAANTSLSNATALVHIQPFELQAFSFSDNSKFDACKLLHKLIQVVPVMH